MRFNGRHQCKARAGITRDWHGGTIAETGPALLILLCFIVFPMIMILGLGAQYACAWYHNHLMINELSERQASDGGAAASPTAGSTTVVPSTVKSSPVGQLIANNFDSTGMAKFSRVTSFNDTVTYYAATATSPARVECSTSCTGVPFIPIPMFGFDKTHYIIAGEALREVTQ